MGAKGDTGAELRDTMKAMVLFGVPPEKYWPYKISRYEEEPTPFCYAFAQSYQAVKYYRLDPPGTAPTKPRWSSSGWLPFSAPGCAGSWRSQESKKR